MNKVFLRAPYNYDTDAVSKDNGLLCLDESLAQQQFKDDADINTIVRRFGLTGQLPDNVRLPQYGDFTNVQDFQSAMQAVREAQEGFNALPADVRYRFANDPQRLLEFLADDSNRDEAVKLGLVNAPAVVSDVAAVVESPKP